MLNNDYRETIRELVRPEQGSETRRSSTGAKLSIHMPHSIIGARLVIRYKLTAIPRAQNLRAIVRGVVLPWPRLHWRTNGRHQHKSSNVQIAPNSSRTLIMRWLPIRGTMDRLVVDSTRNCTPNRRRFLFGQDAYANRFAIFSRWYKKTQV